MKPAKKPVKPTTQQTEMTVMTPRGGRFHVTQRDGVFDEEGNQVYTHKELTGTWAKSDRTWWRRDNRHTETPLDPGHNFSSACVEARAEALVDLRAPKSYNRKQRNERMEKTDFGEVTRGTHVIETCLTCQAARKAGSLK